MEWNRLEEFSSRSMATSVEAGPKLGLTSSNRCRVDGTHDGEMSRLRIGDRGMANNPRDSRRKDKLITDRHILIDIYRMK